MILLNVNGENRLNNYAAFVANRYQWMISAGGPWKCDDDTSDNLSTGDFGKFMSVEIHLPAITL